MIYKGRPSSDHENGQNSQHHPNKSLKTQHPHPNTQQVYHSPSKPSTQYGPHDLEHRDIASITSLCKVQAFIQKLVYSTFYNIHNYFFHVIWTIFIIRQASIPLYFRFGEAKFRAWKMKMGIKEQKIKTK